MPAIQWDVVSGDADAALRAAAITRDVLARVKPGSIVVFHANGRGLHTRAVLPEVISALARRGTRLVTVSTLLRLGEPASAQDCYELRPGDNRRYDAVIHKG